MKKSDALNEAIGAVVAGDNYDWDVEFDILRALFQAYEQALREEVPAHE